MIPIASGQNEGFIVLYRNSYNEIRPLILTCPRLSEALEITTARGIPQTSIVAAYSIGKLSMLYRKDLHKLEERVKTKKGSQIV